MNEISRILQATQKGYSNLPQIATQLRTHPEGRIELAPVFKCIFETLEE